jgi:hypothetical protein
MSEFHLTRRGAAFYDRDVPEIARQLARIADALEHLAHAAGAPPPTTTTTEPAEGEDPRGTGVDEPRTES